MSLGLTNLTRLSQCSGDEPRDENWGMGVVGQIASDSFSSHSYLIYLPLKRRKCTEPSGDACKPSWFIWALSVQQREVVVPDLCSLKSDSTSGQGELNISILTQVACVAGGQLGPGFYPA